VDAVFVLNFKRDQKMKLILFGALKKIFALFANFK
jgi:hypothetical protein